MNKAKAIAMVCYGIIALATMAIGVRYLLADQIMSYHLQALGSQWNDLTSGQQIMTLSFMKAGGLGLFITGLAVTFLVIVPFRRDEQWARWALGAITIFDSAVMAWLVYNIKANTEANPPLIPTVAILAIAIAAFAISLATPKASES